MIDDLIKYTLYPFSRSVQSIYNFVMLVQRFYICWLIFFYSLNIFLEIEPFKYEWPRQNFFLQHHYNINQASDKNKEKYQLGDYELIQYQILQTNNTRTVWQTVKKITNEILGVKGLKILFQEFFFRLPLEMWGFMSLTS